MNEITNVILAILGCLTVAFSIAELYIESCCNDFLTNFTIALGGVCGAVLIVVSFIPYI